MDKRVLLQKILAQLASELSVYQKAAQAAHTEATHEQSKAENKYDTRGLEASYLARGQSRQAAEIVQSIEQFKKLSPGRFAEDAPIDVGALVELVGKRERSFYFIGPRSGGMEICCEGKEILVITPQSPLGQQLVGKKCGEQLQILLGGEQSKYRVASVC